MSTITNASGLLRRYGPLAAITLVVALGSGFAGFILGGTLTRTATKTALPTAGADAREAMARRNIVWRTWNGQESSPPDSPEERLGAALALILRSNVPPTARTFGMRAYLQKSAAYFSEGEIAEITRAIDEGSSAERVTALRAIAEKDIQAAVLVDQVLADADRVSTFLAGRTVPLETLPDGTTP